MNNLLKKIVGATLTIGLIFVATACGNSSKPNEENTPTTPTSGKQVEKNVAKNNTNSEKNNNNNNNNSNNSKNASLINLMNDIKPAEVAKTDGDPTKNANKITDFGINLLNKSVETAKKNSGYSKQNILISPVSIMSALGMIENGANGETLKQFEQVFDLNLDDTNKLFGHYISNIKTNPDKIVNIANSIWFNNRFKADVDKDFLQRNANFYQPEIFKGPFNNKTKDAINKWVDKNTNKMIDKIIDQIHPEAAIYLINALAFESSWKEPFKKQDVTDDKFTTEDGEELTAKLMYSEENSFLESDDCTGVIKPYQGAYSFIGLLPNEGFTVQQVLANLDAEKVNELIESSRDLTVHSFIPKFKSKYQEVLNENLAKLGLEDAFNSKANFDKMGKFGKDVFISQVIHKTFIDVNETGTKAAAVTAIEGLKGTAMNEKEEKVVKFNKPFIYMIYDEENKTPLFIGTMMNPKL